MFIWRSAQQLIRSLFCLVLLSLVVSCSENNDSQLVVRVGFNSWPGFEPIYLAKIKGYYEARRINVKLVELSSAGDVRRAFERNQIDIMASTLVELAIAAENTRQHPKIIAVTDTSNGADAIFATDTIKSIPDLRGKRIGLEGGTVDILVVIEALRLHNMTLDDVISVAGPQDDLVVEMENGYLDAIKTYPPHSIRLMKKAGIHKIFDTSIIPDSIVDIISVNATFAAEHPQLVKQFLQAIYDAFDFRDANPTEANKIMAQREQISEVEFTESSKEIILKSTQDQKSFLSAPQTIEKFQRDIDSLKSAKWINSNIKAKELFDPALIE